MYVRNILKKLEQNAIPTLCLPMWELPCCFKQNLYSTMHNELFKIFVKRVSQSKDHWEVMILFNLKLLIPYITVLNVFNWIINQDTLTNESCMRK